MRTIWKAVIAHPGIFHNTVEMPRNADIISTQMQNGTIAMWFMCDPNDEKVIREVFIIGTGHALPTGSYEYAGTVIDGHFVWHVFIGFESK